MKKLNDAEIQAWLRTISTIDTLANLREAAKRLLIVVYGWEGKSLNNTTEIIRALLFELIHSHNDESKAR